MKAPYILLVSMLLATFLQAQDKSGSDAVVPPKSGAAADTAAIQKRIEVHAHAGLKSPWHSVRDSIFYTKYNKYGDLKDDDPEFNPRKPWWTVALKVTGANVLTTAVGRYVFRYDFSRVGFNTWKRNLQGGWEWDVDEFGLNFFAHPYAGAGYYNSALSSGYNFYQAIPFAVGGSLMYEYFGENTRPSINDAINTPVSGAFLGEILYRLSSNILDDRATGSNRFFRELAAAVINPSRAFGRLTAHQMSRHTSKEIYQKEPLNLAISSGFRKLNNGSGSGKGAVHAIFDLYIDYGNPFEIRSRKPFDYFKMRTDINVGGVTKIVDDITGSGIIYGNNVTYRSIEMLVGLFQHYDYWDNKAFELGAIMFGGGVVSKLPLPANSNLYSNIHLGVVPLAGSNTKYEPDTSKVRDYNYNGGVGGKLESTLELGRWASTTFIGNYYWLHTYVGRREHRYIGIIRPSVEVRPIKDLSFGFEHLIYYSDRYPAGYHSVHLVRTEQRLYLKLYFEQFRRKD